jgi:hypothetical protein
VSWKPIAQVHFEMLRRNAENTIAQDDRLTLVIDEFATTIASAPEVRQYVLDLWLMGASSKIRVIVLAPEVNVKAWGIEGRGDVRDNLLFAKVAPDRTVQMGRLDGQGRLVNPRHLDTRSVVQLAAQAQLSFRAWPGLSETADRRGTIWPARPRAPRLTRHRRRRRDADRSRATPRSTSCEAWDTSAARPRYCSGSRARASTTIAGPPAMLRASTGAARRRPWGFRRLMVMLSSGAASEWAMRRESRPPALVTVWSMVWYILLL